MIEHVSLKHQTNGRRQGVAEAQEMPALGHIIERLTTSVDNAETWIEMVRDLREPIPLEFPDIAFNIRWAEKADIVEIAALEGFVKEIDVMTRSLRHGDRCILFEKMGRIVAFAWIAFRDYRLSVWRKLHCPPMPPTWSIFSSDPSFAAKAQDCICCGVSCGVCAKGDTRAWFPACMRTGKPPSICT
jgi:hypothetical protein